MQSASSRQAVSMAAMRRGSSSERFLVSLFISPLQRSICVRMAPRMFCARNTPHSRLSVVRRKSRSDVRTRVTSASSFSLRLSVESTARELR